MSNIKTPKNRRKRELDLEDITSSLEKNYKKLDFNFKKRSFKFTEKQKELIDIIKNPENKVIIIEGVAGTSKTLIATYCALTLLKEENFEKILYIRSVIESAHKSLGFLPGTLDEKMQMWRAPLDDKLLELVEDKDLSILNSSGKIEVVPINYVRGASWRNSFVIFDEFQNTLLTEAKTLMTRIGEGTKLVLCGDVEQADIDKSSFKQIINMFDNEESKRRGIATFKFEEKDIVRSEIVKYIVESFKKIKS